MRLALALPCGKDGPVTQTILITGASRGLGLALTETYASQGFTVFAGHRGPAPNLDKLTREASGTVVPVRLDVTNPDVIRSARVQVLQHTSGLDVLINNAAVLLETGRGRLETMNIEVGLETFDANSLGPLRVVQAFLPLLRAGTRKLIVNVSSEAGSIADCWRKDEHLYCMSKAALNVQTAILRNQLAPEGFELLAVHPGWMRTEMGGPNADIDSKEAAAGILELTQTRRDPAVQFYVDYLGTPLRW